MSRLLLKGGRVIDPVNKRDEVADLLVEDGRIAEVKPGIEAGDSEVIDCSGKLVCPGFLDIHVHLREPGFEESETISSGTAAAAAGGFTGVCCMPNTSPPADNASVIEYILEVAERKAAVPVYPIGAVTRGQEGKELAEIGEMVEAGAVAVTDDGSCVMSSKLMRRAMEYASTFGIKVIQHAEDHSLTEGGVANEGAIGTMLGLSPMPGVAEEIIVRRDIALAEYLKLPVHIAHISVAGAVRAVREAKERGVQVTCEVTPHHFTLSDAAIEEFDTNTKMNPPLRAAEDVEECARGLADGTIDCIATDHAPHHVDKKNLEFDLAAFGITGLETCVGLTFDRLVHREFFDFNRMVELLAVNPAKIIGLDRGHLTVGAEAFVTILDPEAEWTVRAEASKSLSRNTPFDGWRLKGAPAGVVIGGKAILP
ncbi:MAG TPA: dihydroorotase [Acidobacteriota bacterium]|nr:dihydroorotase [Acidobacteriota bacterium]